LTGAFPLTAQTFVSDLLVRLGVQFLAVGDDFRFGAGRRGISCYYRKPVWNTALTSPARKPSARVREQHGGAALADDDLELAENCWAIRYHLRARGSRR
jgi:riboflavin kinase/FMN adenylyltransferase